MAPLIDAITGRKDSTVRIFDQVQGSQSLNPLTIYQIHNLSIVAHDLAVWLILSAQRSKWESKLAILWKYCGHVNITRLPQLRHLMYYPNVPPIHSTSQFVLWGFDFVLNNLHIHGITTLLANVFCACDIGKTTMILLINDMNHHEKTFFASNTSCQWTSTYVLLAGTILVFVWMEHVSQIMQAFTKDRKSSTTSWCAMAYNT